ncbi:FKBP-type peptidyl-prolyl cis-trans isomerase [Sphingomonas sp.]|uniref:FKBP-type peptidyl-prolyl cis-trans isomerase n=1 Tax=Sphingomonas sp. TaxID=28214 RepID=UPI003D6D79A3
MASIPPKPVVAPGSKPGNGRALIFGLIGIAIGVAATLGVIKYMDYSRAQVTSGATFLAKNRSADKTIVETPSGLQYKILTAGKGGKPTDSDVVLINYEGKLTDGTTFDKSPQPIPLQVTGVVPGFSEALKLMPKGGKYRFWIKPSLGYGDKTSGTIPANSVLVFDVELLDFIPEAKLRQMQMQQQMMQQGAGGPGAGAPPAGAVPKP